MVEFPIIDVRLTGQQPGATSPFIVDASEQLGSKEKFWCEQLDSHRKYLLKLARPNTGEDWAEKLACEVAGHVFGLPHAAVELATYDGRAAVLSEFFPREDERLIHGNELLFERDASYPHREIRRVRKHTLSAVFEALTDVRCPVGLEFPPEVQSAADLFCGYVVFDVLIGNTDRHHENWGVLVSRSSGTRILTLAPTYDHGSSLGRELRDAGRERKLVGMDNRASLASYAYRAPSAFYGSSDDEKPLALTALFAIAAQQRPAAVRSWVSRLVSSDNVRDFAKFVDRVPNERMSPISKQFALGLLCQNLQTIVDLLESP